jgi:hypothetical protein
MAIGCERGAVSEPIKVRRTVEKAGQLTNVGRRSLEQWRLSDASAEAPESKAATRQRNVLGRLR